MAQTAQVSTTPPPADNGGDGPQPSQRTPPAGSGARLLKKLPPYALIAPALALITAVLLWPTVQMAWNSLHTYTIRHLNPTGPAPEWNNFEHYRTLLTDQLFWSVLGKTALICALMVGITLVLGTLIGQLLHKLPKAFSTFVAFGMMLAWATPAISAALVFRWLFFPGRGYANVVLDRMPDWLVGAGWRDYNWFLEPTPLFTLLIVVIVWQSFPFIAMSVLAGLKSIPHELYEAARVDGAGAWRSFWTITFPMLRPLFSLLLVLQIIWDLRVFTQLYVLTGSSFSNEETFLLSYYIYQQGFSASPANFGMGSAIAVVMTVLVLAVAVYYLRIMIRQGETR